MLLQGCVYVFEFKFWTFYRIFNNLGMDVQIFELKLFEVRIYEFSAVAPRTYYRFGP